MKNTTAQQEAMKNDFRFGVEVEMNGIGRGVAAEIAANFFGTDRYANTASRNAYMTWSAYDAQGREWKFSKDSSIAGLDYEKTELITPVLGYDDIPMLKELLSTLKDTGAVSCPNVGAGVHIHVSRCNNFSVKDIKNIVNIMAAHEEQIGRAIKIAEKRTERYCKVISPEFLKMMREQNPTTMKELEECWYVGNNGKAAYRERLEHYNKTRYHALNLHSFFNGHGTVEFRLFQFSNENGIDCDEMEAYIMLCLGIAALACSITKASSKPQQTENEKYALRCWLLRLGFIGDEFKTAREVLLKNFAGSSAWRDR